MCCLTFWKKCTWLLRRQKILAKNIIDELRQFEFKGVTVHAEYKMKGPQPELIKYLYIYLNIFAISIWYNKNNQPYAIGVKCKNFKKVIGYNIQNKPFNKFITHFLLAFCFSILGLHGLLSTITTPSLMSNNCVLLGCIIVYGIILKYAHSYMSIYVEN